MSQAFLIGPFEVGIQKDLKPWLIPDQAFRKLEDCYLYHKRIRKRFGYSLLGGKIASSRLGFPIGTIDDQGSLVVTLPLNSLSIGQGISINNETYTITNLDPFTLSPSDITGKFFITEGKVELSLDNALPGARVSFHLGLPVVGINRRELNEINFEDTVFHDTKFSYIYNGSYFEKLEGADTWTGEETNFFWGINYRGQNAYETYLYVVNFHDHIRYLPNNSKSWVDLYPTIAPNIKLKTCRLLVAFHNRLIALNTQEDEGPAGQVVTRSYYQRARWTQFGDPRNPDQSWLQSPGRGGFVDAPTRQQITSARIIKGHLIVYFERSTWELEYTGYTDFLFRWRQINSELGCESTFSTVAFDESVVGVGNVGIHACNGVGVGRIDDKIPQEIYKIHNCCASVERIYGIRDFVQEMVYWTIPHQRFGSRFPNRVLAYNYQENAFAYFRDSFTAFGYFQRRESLKWRDVGKKYPTWRAWKAGWQSRRMQSAFPDLIAGNQQGIVFVIDAENNTNSPSLVCIKLEKDVLYPDFTKITCKDHNLHIGDYVRMEKTGKIARVFERIDEDTFYLDTPFINDPGSEELRRVSNWFLLTKQFNFGTTAGTKFAFTHIDFLLDTTQSGEMIVDYITNSGIGSRISSIACPNALHGNMELWSKKEEIDDWTMLEQEYAWHRYFPQAQGSFMQLIITMNDRQIRDWKIAQSSFVLHAMIFYVNPRGTII